MDELGSGVQALLNEATVLAPTCSSAAPPSSRAAEKGHREGAFPTSQEQVEGPRDKQSTLEEAAGWAQHRLGAAASSSPHGHGTVALLRWPGQLHGSWTGSLGQEPGLCCLGLHK